MYHSVKRMWSSYVEPMIARPPRLQVAALCYRMHHGARQVLLITSRDTGRWILPKGWPMTGKSCAGAALQEAWEEAGVKQGRADEQAIGAYHYEKRLKHGLGIKVKTLVYPVVVTELRDRFPEAHQRTRRWMSPDDAAALVHEPELKNLLRKWR